MTNESNLNRIDKLQNKVSEENVVKSPIPRESTEPKSEIFPQELDALQKIGDYLEKTYADKPKEVRDATIAGLQKNAETGMRIESEDKVMHHIKGTDYLEWCIAKPDFIKKFITYKDREYRKREKISNLSEVIEGAPDEVQPAKPGEIPDFFYHGTSKVYDIMHGSKETMQNLRKTFENKTVIDIGAGEGIYGLSQVTDLLGVKNYIAVEPAFYQECVRSIQPEKGAYESVEKIHISKADMLTFMKSLPDQCKDLVILISGIDGLILSTYRDYTMSEKETKNSELAKQYLENFWKEVERVLAPGNGRIVTYASVTPPKEGFNNIYKGEAYEGPVNIFERLNH